MLLKIIIGSITLMLLSSIISFKIMQIILEKEETVKVAPVPTHKKEVFLGNTSYSKVKHKGTL